LRMTAASVLMHALTTTTNSVEGYVYSGRRGREKGSRGRHMHPLNTHTHTHTHGAMLTNARLRQMLRLSRRISGRTTPAIDPCLSRTAECSPSSV
jgi:hypothetical protein